MAAVGVAAICTGNLVEPADVAHALANAGEEMPCGERDRTPSTDKTDSW